MGPSVGDPLAMDRERQRFALAAAGVGTWEWDVGSGEVWWSAILEALVGLAPGAFGRSYAAFLALIHPADREAVVAAIDRALAASAPTEFAIEFRIVGPDGAVRWLAGRGKALFADGAPVRMRGAAWDVTARRRVDSELAVRLRQQAVVAELGRQAVTGTDLDALFADAVARVAETLGVEYAGVLELMPAGQALRLRAGVGWQAGQVGRATVGAGGDTEAGHALKTGEPVIVEDLGAETRFAVPPLLREHGIVSGLSVAVRGEGRPVGVLAAHGSARRAFSAADAYFLRAVANVLAAAVARQAAEGARREEYFRALVQHSADVIAVLDATGTVRFVSDAVERVLGQRPCRLVGTDPFALFHPEDAPAGQRAFADVRAGLHVPPVEARLRHADGSWRWLEIMAHDLFANPTVAGLVVSARDVTVRKAFEAQLAHQALHDPLTGLPNRALFADRVEHALARAAGGNETVALLFLDLDRFKAVNDAFGHEVGDGFLAAVGRRLAGAVRPEDTVARVGGDEFAVLVEGAGGAAAAATVAERLLQALQVPFAEGQRRATVSASVGVALGTGDATPRALLRAADAAMYRAKAAGRSAYAVFDPALDAPALERRELEAGLRRAIGAGELVLRYQPQVDLATGGIRGVEALVRWRRPGRGLVPPAEFVSLAEETGLILPLGRWVLETACRQAAAWRRRFPAAAAPLLAVNVSALELGQGDLPEHLARLLETIGLPPAQLQLEVTESAVVDAAGGRDALRALRALGLRIAVDDFGTGYSTLAALLDSPADTLKLDRTFVGDVAGDAARQAAVRAVAGLAHELGMAVVAEGIERPEELAAVRALGADIGQGYYFSTPIPPRGIAALLQREAPYRTAIAQATGGSDRPGATP